MLVRSHDDLHALAALCSTGRKNSSTPRSGTPRNCPYLGHRDDPFVFPTGSCCRQGVECFGLSLLRAAWLWSRLRHKTALNHTGVATISADVKSVTISGTASEPRRVSLRHSQALMKCLHTNFMPNWSMVLCDPCMSGRDEGPTERLVLETREKGLRERGLDRAAAALLVCMDLELALSKM